MNRPYLFLLLPALLLAACGEPEDTRPGQPVKTRQIAFKEIIKAYEPMGVMLRTDRFEADKFLRLANELNTRKDGPWAHFAADTNYPPTKATAEVWSQTADFEQERDAFLKKVEVLQKAAESKDRKQVEAPYQAVYDSCQSCHRTYKRR